MERAKALLDKMSSPSLYSKSDFIVCGKRGCVLANVDLSNSDQLLECIKSIRLAETDRLDYTVLQGKVLTNFERSFVTDGAEAENYLLSGDGLIFLDGEDGCVRVAVRKYEIRSVSEPPTEGIIKGPREGFIESIKTNLSLLERKLKTPALKIERLKVGRSTQTDVAIVSLDGIADEKIAEKIKTRLKSINIDGVIDTHYVQMYLEPRPYSVFNQSGACEKPDIVAAKLLEGRVAVFMDGTPIVLTFPYMFFEDIQSSEDYYERATFASLIRVTRVLSLMIGLLLPGVFVALECFHFSVLPLQLLITIINATKGVPFPPLAEILFVMFLFEIIREAGVRMPQAMGLAMSIVGALVLGETAVKAGMIGSPAVMIVALSSICTYTVPNAAGSSTIVRLFMTLLGGLLGLYGILIGVVFLFLYMSTLDSYGTPFLAPFAPHIATDGQDGLLKTPIVDITRRPKSIPNVNATRQRGNNG